MDELGPDEQRWLDALRAADEPSAADRARVRAAVVAGIAAGGTAAALGKSGAVAKAVAKAGFFAGAWKIGVAAVVVAAAGGATYVATRSPRAASAPAVATAKVDAPSPKSTPGDNAAAANVAPAPSEVANTSEAPAAPPEIPAAAVAATEPPVVRRAPPRGSSSSRGADDLDGELALLTQAQRALERGDPNAALTALAQDRKEHPQGALAVEREGLRAIASCDAKRPDGRSLAERFVGKNPSSPLVARVKTACLSP